MQRLSEGRERGGSWITRGAVTDRGTRPSRSLKRKIRNHQWEAGDRDSGRYALAQGNNMEINEALCETVK